jgi:hypothetical protein
MVLFSFSFSPFLSYIPPFSFILDISYLSEEVCWYTPPGGVVFSNICRYPCQVQFYVTIVKYRTALTCGQAGISQADLNAH